MEDPLGRRRPGRLGGAVTLMTIHNARASSTTRSSSPGWRRASSRRALRHPEPLEEELRRSRGPHAGRGATYSRRGARSDERRARLPAGPASWAGSRRTPGRSARRPAAVPGRDVGGGAAMDAPGRGPAFAAGDSVLHRHSARAWSRGSTGMGPGAGALRAGRLAAAADSRRGADEEGGADAGGDHRRQAGGGGPPRGGVAARG